MRIKGELLGAAAAMLLLWAGAGQALAQAAVDVQDVGVGASGGDDATLAFGVGNVVASAHLDAAVSGLALAVAPEGRAGSASVRTGPITNNTVTTMSGANRVALNTGIANQGRALAVAAQVSSGD